MTRLSKKLIEQIAHNALVKAGVVEDTAALCVRRAALAEAVRILAWGGAEALKNAEAKVAEVNALIRDLPENSGVYEVSLGRRKNWHDAAFGGHSARLCFSGGGLESACRVVPPCRLLLAADHELSLEFTATEEAAEAIHERSTMVSQQVRAACTGVTTVEKLVKEWPEVAELIPAETKPASTTLAVSTVDLNALIGLGG